MLIVVVIVGVLAVALVPKLRWAQERTNDVVRKKDVKTAADAVAMYYQDNQKFPDENAPVFDALKILLLI